MGYLRCQPRAELQLPSAFMFIDEEGLTDIFPGLRRLYLGCYRTTLAIQKAF